MTGPGARSAALLLAAGRSHRFGDADKLTADLGGKPLFSWPLEVIRKIGVRQIFAVVDDANSLLIGMLEHEGVSVVYNPEPETGQGHSLALGLAALAETPATDALVLLADMPFVPEEHLARLYDAVCHHEAAASEYEGVTGPPVLLTRRAFPAFREARTDGAGKKALQRLRSVAKVPLDRQAALDIDTPADAGNAEARILSEDDGNAA